MAIERTDPYAAFNFKVTIIPGDGEEINAGFSDVSGLSSDINYAEYREGDDSSNAPRKIPGTYTVGDITLKRGLVGAKSLWEWTRRTRSGSAGSRAEVLIRLRSEDGSQTVSTWRLSGARPKSWSGPSLAATGGEVAMEELTLVCEDIVYD